MVVSIWLPVLCVVAPCIVCVYLTMLSVQLHTINWCDDSEMMKGFWRKMCWLGRGNMLAFIWRFLRKIAKNLSAKRMTPSEIRTRLLPNTNLGSCDCFSSSDGDTKFRYHTKKSPLCVFSLHFRISDGITKYFETNGSSGPCCPIAVLQH